jgi:hypothetical protein
MSPMQACGRRAEIIRQAQHIKLVDERVDHAHQVVLGNVVIEDNLGDECPTRP